MKQYDPKRLQHSSSVGTPKFQDIYSIIRRAGGVRAAAVARAYGLARDERKDLEQEAALHVWRRLGQFDPTRSSLNTFIERVVGNQMVSLVRRLQAKKRRARPDGMVRTQMDSGAESVNLQIDILRVLKSLTPAHQNLCRMLARYPPTEVSRRTGISRSSLYRIIGHLRYVFTEAGFHQSSRRGGPC